MSDSELLEQLLLELNAVQEESTAKRASLSQIDEGITACADAIKTVRDDSAAIQAELLRQIEAEKVRRDKAIEADMAKQQELKNARWDVAKEAREAERKAAELERRIAELKKAQERAVEWATLEERWDLLTMGAPWREWAKDHQISGAKKMTYEGRMILGDTMGLGKTLTSLIFIDMVKAATKDAAPDNPIEFGSMK